MSAEQVTLFPVPAIPEEALRDARMALTSALETGRQIERSLTYGSTWTAESAAEMGRLLVASKSIAESLRKLVSHEGTKPRRGGG